MNGLEKYGIVVNSGGVRHLPLHVVHADLVNHWLVLLDFALNLFEKIRLAVERLLLWWLRRLQVENFSETRDLIESL